MPTDYQRQDNKYLLPTAVYHQTLWQIRDYYRLKEIYDSVAEERPGPSDGMPRGRGGTSDPTFQKAVKLEEIGRIILVIESARDMVPEEYRHGVWRSVMFREPFPIDAARGTYGKWKSRFVCAVAKGLHFI